MIKERKDRIAEVAETHFDVIIIGGGITGAGIFLRCCQQGLKTLLIDKDDFGAGTSSRSAKMIHGGLRYLEYLQVKLVKEALEERENLLHSYPHLVKPLPYLMPIYDSHIQKMKIRIGLTGYDALARNSSLPDHVTLSSSQVKKQYPMLRKKGLKGGFFYYDAITNDALLTNEVILQATELGGIALNYVSAEKIPANGSEISTIVCLDRLNGDEIKLSADYFISATGIWTDELLAKMGNNGTPVMKPSKGVHLVVSGEHFSERDVLLIPCSDKRFIWVCPWVDGLVVIGATDTPFAGDLREPGTTEEDIRYLLDNTNMHLENINLTKDDILSVYSGLRPLLNEEGEDNTVKMSRDYRIWWQGDNLLFIAGGKLTSFLSMADSVVKTLAGKTGHQLQSIEKENIEDYTLDVSPLKMEWGNHSGVVDEILNEAEENNEKLVDHLDYNIAAVRYFTRYQHAQKISDVLTRRLALTYGMQTYNEELVNKVAAAMQTELGWSDEMRSERVNDYKNHWDIMHSWTK